MPEDKRLVPKEVHPSQNVPGETAGSVQRPHEQISSEEPVVQEQEIIKEMEPVQTDAQKETMPPTAPVEKKIHLSIRRPPPLQPLIPKDRLAQEIETILEEDLTDVFLGLSPEAQSAFKTKAEETAVHIRILVQSTRINVRKILKLIKEWLQVIPGVSRFFLEQEAKIKTDKILLASEDEKKRQESQML